MRRISNRLDENQPREQAGFRKDYSTIDHLQTVQQVIEKYTEYNKILYIAFVDYNKAFDCIEHPYIWEALKTQGVNKKYIEILKNIYNNSEAKIMLEQPGPYFKIRRGVRQGDPMSPKLFNSVLEWMFNRLRWEEYGINVNGTKITNLRFADDIILFAETRKEINTMLNELSEASKQIGLSINIAKTKIMSNGVKERIYLDNEEIEYVEEYVYLGQVIAFDKQQTKEVARRITNAWKRYWSLAHIFKANIPICLKKQTMNACILPILTYGAQTWTLTEKQIQQLRVCQRGMERSMLGITRKDKTRCSKIREKTKVEDVIQKAKLLKWTWAGHLMRRQDGRWSKIATEWIPREGKRNQGRPYKRWRDELQKMDKKWWRSTEDRQQWKQMGEAFTQQWVDE